MLLKKIFYTCVISFFIVNLSASSVIPINGDKTEQEIIQSCYIFEDMTNNVSISDIIDSSNFDIHFKKNINKKINFGIRNSTYWIKFELKNMTSNEDFILEVANPDINNISFYEYHNGKNLKVIHTGELEKIKNRDIPHHFFLFSLKLKPGEVYTFYFKSFNSGEPNFLPICVYSKNEFIRSDKKSDIVNWLFYGLFIFIIVFNFYLFWAIKDRINLYYSLYILFSTLFLLTFDGYQYFLNTPYITNYFKMVIPVLAAIFLLSFAQEFINTQNLWPHINKFLNYLKIILGTLSVFYFLPYPSNYLSILIMEIIVVLATVFIITLSIKSFNPKYLPSVYFLSAFAFFILGVLLTQFKELGFLPSSFLIENSVRIGLGIECTLLTISVLERFRFQQEESKRIIKRNSEQIEAQKETLEDINIELEKLSIVASETDNGVSIYNGNFDLEYCNKGFEHLFEQNLYSIEKTGDYNITNIEIFTNRRRLVNECINSKKPVLFENNYKTLSGKRIWLQTAISPYLDEVGGIQKLIVIDTDITKMKNYENELTLAKERAEESDKLKSAFLSNMSHEIRTPLNAILGFSELAMTKRGSVEKMDSYLSIIRNNGKHLLKLISDILDISKIESGEIKTINNNGDINKMLQSIYSFYSFDIENKVDKKLTLKLNKLPDVFDPLVITDHSKLRQVIDNLLNNAIKFTDHGEIEFGVTLKDGFLRFYVSDTGIGIPMGKKVEIFERFRQIELGFSRKYEGSGLGLAISKGLVLCMGGQIWLESEFGEGSTFYFTIPYVLANKEEDDVGGSFPSVGAFKGFTILVVEDIDDNYLLLKEMLADTGAKVKHANNGKKAVEMAIRNGVSLILMDLRLPDIDGVQATRLIRKYHIEMPIVAQTANISDNEKERCLKNGFNDFISKPIKQLELIDTLKKHLLKKNQAKEEQNTRAK